MAYSIPHREECLRIAIENRITNYDVKELAHHMVDQYITLQPIEANFQWIADVLISMHYESRYDVLACNPFIVPDVEPDTTFLGVGVYCRCSDPTTVDPVPVARGSYNITEFQIALWRCELDGLSVSEDKYHAPDGTASSCKMILPEYRYIACFHALIGNVTECEDFV